MKALTTLTAAAFLLAAALPAAAQMNYQGRLTNASGNPLPDGQQTLEFSIWNVATGGVAADNQVWGPYTLDGSAGRPFADLVSGRFNVILGPNDTNNPVRPLTSAFNGPRWIQIKVGSNAPISPRQQILAAPDAIHAQIADTVPPGAIGRAQLALGAIGTDQLANGSVTAVKLAGGAAVWQNSGSDVFRPNGNVGIGNSNPAAKLDVTGVIRTFDQSTGSPGFGESGGPGQRIVLWPGASDGIPYGMGIDSFTLWSAVPVGASFKWYEGQTERMRISAGGNVGIGAGAPQAKLHVQGDLLVDGAATINGEEPPLVFEIWTDNNVNTWRSIDIDTAKWAGDKDGFRMKFNFLNHLDGQARTLAVESYVDSDERRVGGPGYRGWSREGGTDLGFVLNTTTQNEIIFPAWSNWLWVRNYRSAQVNGGLTGPAFTGADKYKMNFLVPPNITVTIILFDR